MKRRDMAKLLAAALLPSSTRLSHGAVLGKAVGPQDARETVSEPIYTVLNPEAKMPEIDTKPLSPRLENFAGKTIVIYDGRGGYEKPMQGLATQLKPLLPTDTKLIYYTPSTNASNAAGFEMIPNGDAVIVGHGY